MATHTKVKCYAAMEPKGPLQAFEIERRPLHEHDVQIDIKYAGICHSDCSQVNEEWGKAIFPMVPGHEIAGIVSAVGSEVTKFKVGDRVGVGCLVDSCRECQSCRHDEEQYCSNGYVLTYNSKYKYDRFGEQGNPTYGGYSTMIVVEQHFVVPIPDGLDLAAAAPLLCAGITTYSPIMRYLKSNKKMAVAGLGGLGHLAVKFGVAMGCEVTVLSRSESKKESALELGAQKFLNMKDEKAVAEGAGKFDLIVDTIGVDHDVNSYISLLATNGHLALVGVPPKLDIAPFLLIGGRRTVGGTLIGGLKETEEMLQFCALNNITSDIELISADKINEAYDRMYKSDVKYRFVIDASTF